MIQKTIATFAVFSDDDVDVNGTITRRDVYLEGACHHSDA